MARHLSGSMVRIVHSSPSDFSHLDEATASSGFFLLMCSSKSIFTEKLQGHLELLMSINSGEQPKVTYMKKLDDHDIGQISSAKAIFNLKKYN